MGSDIAKKVGARLSAQVLAQGEGFWCDQFRTLAIALGCLPSSFGDGNAHVFKRARDLQPEKMGPVLTLTESVVQETLGLLQILVAEDQGGKGTGRVKQLRIAAMNETMRSIQALRTAQLGAAPNKSPMDQMAEKGEQ